MKKRLVAFSIVMLIMAILTPTVVFAASLIWHNDQMINDSGKYAQIPDVALSGSNAVAVWYQEDGGINRIYSNYSTDGGESWNTPQLIENNAGQDGNYPEVALDGSNAVVVWRQSDGSNFRIYSNYSSDGGDTWHNAQLIDNNTGKEADLPRVALSGTTAVAVWGQWDGSAPRIYSNYSTDGGNSWIGDKLIENNAGKFGYDPRVALSGTDAVAVWRQSDGSYDRIYSNYSTDGGLSWQINGQVIDNAGKNGFEPQVALSGSNAVAVWRQSDGSTDRIYYNYSTNGGATWNNAQLIENNTAKDGYYPQVALSGNNAVAVWRQWDGSSYRIYCNYSTNGGATWNNAQLIENNAGNSGYYPEVALSGNNTVAVWLQSDGSSDRIYSNYSTDGGATWSDALLIENNSGRNGASPQVALSAANAVAVWAQWDGSSYRVYSNYGNFEAVRARVVGGEVTSVNKLTVLAPWLILAVVLGAGGIIFVFKRRSMR
jgi:hypothetical protein